MKIRPWNLLFAVISSTCLATENTPIPLENAGFEQNLEGWTLQRGTASTTSEAAHEGSSGLRITASENATLSYPPIPIDGLKKYRFSIWVRGLQNSHASVMLSFGDGSQKAMDIENANDFKKAITQGKDWKQISMEITPPESASTLNFRLGVWPKKDAPTPDVIDVDGLSLEEVAGEP
jgi:hypothetical protein